MALLDRSTNSRRRGPVLVTAAAVTLLAMLGPSAALAGEAPPAGPGTSDGAGHAGIELGVPTGAETAGRGQQPGPDTSGGFVYRNGRYIPLDIVDGLITVHLSINNRGQTAGAYFRSELDPGGFVRDRSGDYTRFDVPPGPSTLPFDIDDRGTTVGLVGNQATMEGGGSFLRTANGVVRAVEVPGASETGANGINNRGAVVGSFLDAAGVSHAFLTQGRRVTTLRPPDAADDPAAANVVVFDLNDRAQAVGCYADANGTYHGFRYDRGRFTRIDPPGAADVPTNATTCAFGINNRGHVVGQYVDAAGVLHGYLWQRGRGFQTIDPPRGAPTVGPDGTRGTVAADINDRGDVLLPIPGGFRKGRVPAAPVGG